MPPLDRDDAPRLRASDAEREAAVDQLRVHAAAGRIDPEELDERTGRALAARHVEELSALLVDLPPAQGPRRQAAAPAPRRHGACSAGKGDPRGFVPIALLLVAIWAVTGAGYFWPIWPLMWFAFAAVMHATRSGPRRPARQVTLTPPR